MNDFQHQIDEGTAAADASNERIAKLESPPRLTLREWAAIVLLFFFSVVGVHAYDAQGAHSAAKSSAGVVYTTQLAQCKAANPTRAIQRQYFATVALGRATSAQHEDAGKPIQHKVDHEIATVAHAVAETYINRTGARPNGSLYCAKVTKRP